MVEPLKLCVTTLVLAGIVVTGVAGCKTPNIPGVYRIDIQQGNVVDEEMLAKLETGMEMRKVRFLLGTPLVVDTFNQGRWDYLYSYQKGGGERVQRRVSLFFDGDLLARIEGDVKPALGARNVAAPKDTVVLVPATRRKKGFLDGLTPAFLTKDRGRRPTRQAEPAGEEPPTPATTPDTVREPPLDTEIAGTSTGAPAPATTPDRDAEPSVGTEVEGTDLPSPASEPVESAPKSASISAPASASDQTFFKRIFKGFGRKAPQPPDTSDPSRQAVAPGGASAIPAATATPGEPATTRPRESAAPATMAEPGTPDRETGFFKRLVKRFRKLREEQEPSQRGDDGVKKEGELAAEPPALIEQPSR